MASGTLRIVNNDYKTVNLADAVELTVGTWVTVMTLPLTKGTWLIDAFLRVNHTKSDGIITLGNNSEVYYMDAIAVYRQHQSFIYQVDNNNYSFVIKAMLESAGDTGYVSNGQVRAVRLTNN